MTNVVDAIRASDVPTLLKDGRLALSDGFRKRAVKVVDRILDRIDTWDHDGAPPAPAAYASMPADEREVLAYLTSIEWALDELDPERRPARKMTAVAVAELKALRDDLSGGILTGDIVTRYPSGRVTTLMVSSSRTRAPQGSA